MHTEYCASSCDRDQRGPFYFSYMNDIEGVEKVIRYLFQREMFVPNEK